MADDVLTLDFDFATAAVAVFGCVFHVVFMTRSNCGVVVVVMCVVAVMIRYLE